MINLSFSFKKRREPEKEEISKICLAEKKNSDKHPKKEKDIFSPVIDLFRDGCICGVTLFPVDIAILTFLGTVI